LWIQSTILGKAKIMSYEDILEAQPRHYMEKAYTVSGKLGRKHKGFAAGPMQAIKIRKNKWVTE
jgi:murein tripeptide amidase MpaA